MAHMKIVTVGASGYLGAEVHHQASSSSGFEALGTSRNITPDLLQFELERPDTWQAITAERPDVLVWTAWSRTEYTADGPFPAFLMRLGAAKIVYISSDVTSCARTLAAPTDLGAYARRKQAEERTVLADPQATVFTVGPIFGRNAWGKLDSRTSQLLAEPDKTHSYWENAHKTFVPVGGLARTLLANLDKQGKYFIGPPTRQSYYEFYRSRANEHDIPISNIQATKASDAVLRQAGVCADTSYADNPARLWSALPDA